MSENKENIGSFGITEDLKAGNKIPFKAGIQKGLLTEVKSYEKESKRGEKYTVIEFKFVDFQNEASFDKIFFAVDPNKENADKQTKALNVAIKHIYEAYTTFPKAGIGMGAKNWAEYFDIIAKAFNENGKDNNPIFKSEGKLIPVSLKFTYFKNELGFPYTPNFIEIIREGKPTNLTIDLKWDTIEQTKPKEKSNSNDSPIFGGESIGKDEFDSFLNG